jgi:hypothetical protein
LLVLLIVLSPVVQNLRDEPEDGFPLSYYPMFTNPREGRTTLVHPIGIRADASEIDLPYTMAGSGGMNEVRKRMNRLVQGGGANELCRLVARRVRNRGLADQCGLTAVAIVRDTYELDQFFGVDRRPKSRRTLAKVDLP